MKQKKILILVIIIVIIVLGVILALREDIIRVPEPVFEPDETIAAEICRRAITRAQLREITGKDDFVFEQREDEFPGLGLIKTCDIRLAEDEAVEMMPEMGMPFPMGPAIGIGFFSEEITYETVKEQLTGFLMPDMEIKEVEDIGEKAFSVSWGEGPPALEFPEQIEGVEELMPEDIGFPEMPEMHEIIFLDGDINQVIGVMVQEFSYEILIELAGQIERNLK